MGSSVANQEPWIPFEPTKDCSQGLCSIYCPQWCYIIFPPPPPFFSDDEQSSWGRTFSPLVITIIGVLASAFLLVSYYTIISKYCFSFSTLRRRFHRHHHVVGPEGTIEEDPPGASSRRYETWYNSPSNGLDEALINKITVCKYKRGDGLIGSTDCSVCLSEFRDDESVRLLPKCNHAFHLHCIDTWLKSHSNCPLCRASIVSVNPMPPPLQLPAPPEPPPQPETGIELAVVAVEESNPREEEEEEQQQHQHQQQQQQEEENHESNNDLAKNNEREGIDHKVDVVKEDETVQVIRRSFSMDSSSSSLHRGRVSIADVLRLSIDDECQVFEFARENKGSSSNRIISRGLHCVMSPVPMKRSFSSGRFCFTRHAKEKTSVLPL